MKKPLYILTALAALSLAACSNGDKAEEPKKEVTEQKAQTETKEQTKKKQAHKHEEGEPQESNTCAFCDKKVFFKSEDIGQFTAKNGI